jgi:phosphatidylglycerophosphate synthase
MRRPAARLTSAAALLVGIGLLVVVVRRADADAIRQVSALFGVALPLALVPGAAWHLLRTAAWRQCFPAGVPVSFARMFRVRISAEAFSYATINGVTGEPLKVVLLAGSIPPAVSAAAIALERVAYLTVTAAMIAVSAAAAVALLPLSPRWSQVYTWTAVIAATVAVVPILLVVRGRGTAPSPPAVDTARRQHRARRFLSEFARQFRVLASGDRRRLTIIAGLEAAAFLMMALEVLAALILTGTPISLVGAMAIECFTRIASFASGFIPANLGALELSNVAAAAAVHAASGGVALALLRRIRGLGWCAAGFLLYPRMSPHRDDGPAAPHSGMSDARRTLVALQCADSDAMIRERLGGLPIAERIGRAALRAGFTRLLVWSPRHAHEWRAAARRLGRRLDIVATGDLTLWRQQWSAVDPRTQIAVIGPGIVAPPQLLATTARMVTAGELAAPHDMAARLLREEAAGEALRVMTRAHVADAERRLRASIFKATDGPLARFNRRLSIPISIALIRAARLSANAMSVFVIAMGLYAGWLFSHGTYAAGVIAALVSWAASVLDGCDGELARLQFKESAFGCWVDTLGDYVYYIAVFAGLTVGAARYTGSALFWWCGAALSIGVLLTLALLILLRWRATGGHPEHLRSRTTAHFAGSGKRWARLAAKLAPCATRATMPYGIVMFAVLGLLPVVVVLATIGANLYWISLAREFRRMVNDSGPAAGWPIAESAGRPDRSTAPGW